MLKNVNLAFSIAFIGSFLCRSYVVACQDEIISTSKKFPFLPDIIAIIAEYCMPTAEFNLIVDLHQTNNIATKKASTPTYFRDAHFELLFLSPHHFRLHRLIYCQNRDVDYLYTSIEKNPSNGRWCKVYTHQAIMPNRYGDNRKQYQEEIHCLNVIEKCLGKPYYRDADVITSNGITSLCTISPYDDGIVVIKIAHNTKILADYIVKVLNP